MANFLTVEDSLQLAAGFFNLYVKKESIMTKHLAIRKRVVHFLIFFFTVTFLAPTVVAAEFPSLTPPADSPTEIAETINQEGTKKAVGYKSLMVHGKSENAEDLMHAYKLARENDPTFQSAKYIHEASPETIKQAYSELLPSVSADAFYQHTRQEIFSTDVAVYGEDRVNFPSKGYNLILTQPLFRYSSIVRVLQAKEEVKSADLEFEAAKQDLILRVAVAYIKTLEAYENLEFTRAEEEALKLHFELAQARYDSGLAPITDFHDAKARLAFLTARICTAKNRLDDALEAMAELTGQKIDNLAKLKYALIARDFNVSSAAKTEGNMGVEHESAQVGMPLVCPDPDDINDWIDAALKQNLEVQIRQQEVLVAKREIERQKAGHWPTLAFVGRLNRDDEGGSLFGGDSDVETREAILQLNFPIFQGGSVSSKTREALKLYKATEQDLEKEIRAVKRETKAGFLGVKSAIENTRAFIQSLVSNQIALEAKREGFKSGLFPSLVVLDAERDLHQAKLEYAKAQYEYILNSLRLKKAVSTLNEEDLAGINQWLE
jgi:outer membrane protein